MQNLSHRQRCTALTETVQFHKAFIMGCHLWVKYRPVVDRGWGVWLTGDEGISSATQSKWHSDSTFILHNGQFALNMYFILFSYLKMCLSICTWTWNPDTYFHKHAEKSRGFCRIISFYNKWNLNFSTPEQTHSKFSSHIACTRILKDIIRLRPAQLMTNHPDA